MKVYIRLYNDGLIQLIETILQVNFENITFVYSYKDDPEWIITDPFPFYEEIQEIEKSKLILITTFHAGNLFGKLKYIYNQLENMGLKVNFLPDELSNIVSIISMP